MQTDLTETQELKALAKRYQALFEYSNDAIFIHDLEGKIVEVNKKAEEMFGRSKEEFLTLFTYNLPSENGKERCRKASEILKEQGSVRFECNFISQDKTVFPVEVVSSIIDVDGLSLVQAIIKDVSQEQETIEALKRSNEQYQSLFENTAFGALVIDNQTMEVLNCNKMASEMLGIELNHTKKWNARMLHEDLSKTQRQEHNYQVAHHHSHSYNASVIDKNGKKIELLISCRQIQFNNVSCHLSILVDITEKKNYELELEEKNKELKKSEERWVLALEGANHGVWDWNIADNSIFFSKQWSIMLGYHPSEIENSLNSCVNLLHPEDSKKVLSSLNDYVEGRADKFQLAFRMRCKDGSYKWIMSQATIWDRDNENKPLRMVGTHSDVTEMKEAADKEKRLIDLIEASSNEIYVFEKESLRFNYINQGGISNLQYTSEELLNKQHPYDIKPNFTEEGFRAYIQPLLDNSIHEQRFETVHQRKDGSTYPVQIHLQLLKTKLTQEFLAVITDITEQKKMNRKLEEQEEIMLVQSRHAAMGEMISMIAHQWRQPISVVGLLANNMKHMIDVGKIENQGSMQEDLQTIGEQIQYMSKTINDFRNFFQKSNAIEEMNLYYLLIEAKSIIGAVFQRHRIKLIIDCPISITLQTYSRELVQVFINILSNAKDALEKVSSERTIIIHVLEHKETVQISIFNNGLPIKESIKNKIFEPYFTTKGNLGGTGLGLYMVKSILDKHMNGTIAVENRDDGVAFKIILPKILERE